MHPLTLQVLAADRELDRLREADAERLAATARRPRPSLVARLRLLVGARARGSGPAARRKAAGCPS